MSTIKQLPPRSKVKIPDTWDLSSLFPRDEAWEKAFTAWEKRIAGYAEFRGTLDQFLRMRSPFEKRKIRFSCFKIN